MQYVFMIFSVGVYDFFGRCFRVYWYMQQVFQDTCSRCLVYIFSVFRAYIIAVQWILIGVYVIQDKCRVYVVGVYVCRCLWFSRCLACMYQVIRVHIIGVDGIQGRCLGIMYQVSVASKVCVYGLFSRCLWYTDWGVMVLEVVVYYTSNRWVVSVYALYSFCLFILW